MFSINRHPGNVNMIHGQHNQVMCETKIVI